MMTVHYEMSIWSFATSLSHCIYGAPSLRGVSQFIKLDFKKLPEFLIRLLEPSLVSWKYLTMTS